MKEIAFANSFREEYFINAHMGFRLGLSKKSLSFPLEQGKMLQGLDCKQRNRKISTNISFDVLSLLTLNYTKLNDRKLCNN